MLPQDTTHLIQRPCYQQGSPCQDPAGNWTTRRHPDDCKETQTAVVWSCFPFIRSGQNHLARHSERGKKIRQTEEEVGRQHQGIDRPWVCQVPEGIGTLEKTGCKIICSAPTILAVKGLMMMMMFVEMAPPTVISDRGQSSGLYCRSNMAHFNLSAILLYDWNEDKISDGGADLGHDDLTVLGRSAAFCLANDCRSLCHGGLLPSRTWHSFLWSTNHHVQGLSLHHRISALLACTEKNYPFPILIVFHFQHPFPSHHGRELERLPQQQQLLLLCHMQCTVYLRWGCDS